MSDRYNETYFWTAVIRGIVIVVVTIFIILFLSCSRPTPQPTDAEIIKASTKACLYEQSLTRAKSQIAICLDNKPESIVDKDKLITCRQLAYNTNEVSYSFSDSTGYPIIKNSFVAEYKDNKSLSNIPLSTGKTYVNACGVVS